MRRAFWRSAWLLHLWATPESNPFLQRALRVEERKKKPFRLVAILMLLITLLNGGLWWFWTWLLQTHARELKNIIAPYELPRFLGGNVLSGVAIFTLLCCVVAAIFVCGSRASQNLRREVLGGTLEQLILLPQREERWLWQMRAQPLALSLLFYLCGLPVFMLAVFTGTWHFLDLIGLLFLFVAIGHMAPGWMPLQWQAKQFQGKKFDLRAWQAAVKALQQEGKETTGKFATGEAAALENQRRMARLWETMEPVSDTARTADGKKPLLVGAQALTGSAQNTGKRGFSWLWFVGFQMIGPGTIMMRATGSPLRLLWDNFTEALPRGVTDLAPAFFVTWPLLIERILLTPLPFFAFALPPFILYLPLWLARQSGGNLQLAAQVSPGEIFWTKRRLRTRRVCSRWILGCALLMLLGYSWQTLIGDSVLAMLLRGAPLTSPWALATLWTLCLGIGVFAAGEAKEKPFKQREEQIENEEEQIENSPSTAATWRQAARLMAGYFLFSIFVYLVFCLLGKQAFFGAPMAARLLPVLGTALAYLLADYGSTTLQYALPKNERGTFKAIVAFWVIGLALAALAHSAAGVYYQNPFTFDQAPYVVLSPLVTVFALLRADLNGGVPWWLGPALQSLIGLACLLFAALKMFGVPQMPTVAVSREDEDRLPAPLRWIKEFVTGIWNNITAFFGGCMEIVRRVDEGLVEWSQRFKNPILSDELQRRLRREHWPLGWMVLFLMAAGFLAQGFYFAGAAIQGRYIGGAALAVMLVFAFTSSLRLGLCFDRDRANGTLVFIFLTPLSETEIASGKLLANLIYSGGALLTLLPFLLIGMAIELIRGNLLVPLVGVLLFLLVLSMTAYFSGLNLLGATWARKPTQGTSLAILMILLGQIIVFLPATIFLIFSGNFAGNIIGDAFYYITGAAIFTLNCAVAFFAWRGVLKLLRRQRYADDVTSGKRTG